VVVVVERERERGVCFFHVEREQRTHTHSAKNRSRATTATTTGRGERADAESGAGRRRRRRQPAPFFRMASARAPSPICQTLDLLRNACASKQRLIPTQTQSNPSTARARSPLLSTHTHPRCSSSTRPPSARSRRSGRGRPGARAPWPAARPPRRSGAGEYWPSLAWEEGEKRGERVVGCGLSGFLSLSTTTATTT
jgi:hypothetical protein